MNWRKWLFRLVILPIAGLPETLRYKLSDGIAYVLKSLVKYRRRVIEDNLTIAFPHKSAAERGKIRDDFYTHFTDVALEQTWLFKATNEELLERSRMTNPEVLERFAKAGKPVMIGSAHHNNYEMGAASLAMQMSMPIAAIYAPLANAYFDGRVRETRGKFGLQLWPRGDTPRLADAWHEAGGAYAIGFAFDQSPHIGKRKWWVPFFGRMTAVSGGIEAYAKKYDAAVAYISMKRLARGRYEYTVEVISENARDEPPGYILAKVNSRLEAVLRNDPVGWLWSHRRWKLNFKEHLREDDSVYNSSETVQA